MSTRSDRSVIRKKAVYMKKNCIVLLVLILSGCSSLDLAEHTPELHAIGVYQGTNPGDDGRPWHSKCGELDLQSCHQKVTQKEREVGGQVIVNVSIDDRPIILGLSAYDKTKWIIKADEDTVIKKVIIGGYHAQSVEGVSNDTSIEVYTRDSSPCERCYQGQGYFYSHKSAPPELQKISGMPVSSWNSRYRGVEFSISPEVRRLNNRK